MTPNAPFALRPVPLAGASGPRAPVVETFAPVTRVKLWELPSHLLCSIVGTCLSTAELRKLVAKVLAQDLRDLGDVEIHTEGVSMAGERGAGSRALNKALDQRHATWVKRLGRNVNLAALNAAWDEALRSGDIPGAYWAVMSHPNTDSALTKRAFGDIHMLSHLVGSANRADLRKLKALETERDELVDRIDRQQSRLREAQSERDVATRRLDALLIERSAGVDPADLDEERAALRALVDQQRRTIEQQARRQHETEQKLAASREGVDTMRERVATSEARASALADEVAALESLQDGRHDTDLATLDDVVLLYVGGQAATIASMRRVVGARGGTLLHHDGGLEERMGQLAGPVSRATIVVFPVDFVSHEAVLGVKRLCRQFDRPYLALRSAGLSSLVAAFERVAAASRPRVTIEAA